MDNTKKIVTVYRIIKYEGSDEWIDRQLGKSLPDGIKNIPFENGTITVATVHPTDGATIGFCKDATGAMMVSTYFVENCPPEE